MKPVKIARPQKVSVLRVLDFPYVVAGLFSLAERPFRGSREGEIDLEREDAEEREERPENILCQQGRQ